MSYNVTFVNNPFGYRHVEEQYVTNPNDKVILNFGAEVRTLIHTNHTEMEELMTLLQ